WHAVRSDSWRLRAHRSRRGAQYCAGGFGLRSAGGEAGLLRRLSTVGRRCLARRRVALVGAADRHRGAIAMTPLLSLQAVSKRFRGLVAVDAVSFDVAPGELFAIIGPNGAGKTTLFNMIAGAIAPDEGLISFAGESIGGLPPDTVCRRGIG